MLGTNVKYKVAHDSVNKFVAQATLNNRELKLSFVKDQSLSAENAADTWDCELIELTSSGSTVRATGHGSPFQVFAFVTRALEEFVERYKPQRVKMTADSEQRSRIYTQMLKKAKLSGYAWERVRIAGDSYEFRLTLANHEIDSGASSPS